MYVKVESERLRYVRFNQARLRADDYIHLRDAMRNDADPTEIGRRVILPSSFTGGPRYMKEKTQDAMTYVRERGRPQLFITFTCNPKWPEMKIAPLGLAGGRSYDRTNSLRTPTMKESQLLREKTTSSVFVSTCSNAVHAQFH